MKIAFSGDWHGKVNDATAIIRKSVLLGAEAVIQLGDFGLWPNAGWYLDEVSAAAVESGVDVYWIDGNHEWHDEIDRWTAEYGHQTPITVRPRLFYLPRGCRITLGGVRYGALGGAFSVDYLMRTLGASWWPQEQITAADVERLGDAPLDVLLTHDAPERLDAIAKYPLSDTDEAKCEWNRKCIREAIRNTRPRFLLHGHWHHWYSEQFPFFYETPGGMKQKTVYVRGLGCSDDTFHRHTNIVDMVPNKLVF